MDIWKFFAVGHTNHVFYNPMSEGKFDELIERLALPPDARVLDIACGSDCSNCSGRVIRSQ